MISMTLNVLSSRPRSNVAGTLVMAASRSDEDGTMHSWAGEGGNKPWLQFV